jgi:hypothetical protein
MRLTPHILVAALLFAGCIIPAPEEPTEAPVTAVEITTTTTASTTTTTTHSFIPIKNPSLPLLTTTTTSFTTTSITPSSSTSTTITLVLKRREYNIHGNNSFYLTDIEKIGGTTYYTLKYNTTDDKWDTITLTNTTLIDELELGIQKAETEPKLTVTIYLKESEYVKDNLPNKAKAIKLGGGLQNRTFSEYYFSLDSLHSERVKIWVATGNETMLLDLHDSDIAYYKDLELGVIDTRLPGGYALIYALKDKDAYKNSMGARYCLRTYQNYTNAKSLLLNGLSATEYSGMNLTVRSIQDGAATVGITGKGIDSDFNISCGTRLELSDRKYNLIWYGTANKGTAKLVAHD